MWDAAIVTGASSGIGLAVSKMLCGLGYQVFGIGRDFDTMEFKETAFDEDRFHKVVCDIMDTDRLCNIVKEIAAQNRIVILVNNAGTAYYGLHEELNAKKIQQMVRTNLEVPMVLACQLLRKIKQNRGYIINISSVTAKGTNPHGCAYGATKAGLASFSQSLFDEARKYGVKVVTIFPDMTKTNLYRNADFEQGNEEESYLMPEEVAQAVEYVLNCREGLVVSDITLKPQIHRVKRKGLTEGK